MMQKIGMAGVVLLATAGLAGCSPHPGAGNWAAADPATPFAKLLVHFEGRAELVDAASGAESHHCFWGAKNDGEIQLDCTTPEDTETRIRFNLRVEGDGTAQLFRDEALIGRFRRTPEG
jgi:hypothetical protein